MIVSFTGHRPDKLGGYSIPNPTYNHVRSELIRVLTDLKPSIAVSGMALGVDQWAAQVCLDMDVPLIAAVPFAGQQRNWPQTSQDAYKDLVGRALHVAIICGGGYSAWKMQRRNIWMVDNSDVVVAVFDGTSGGTKNCVDYATSRGKKIVMINPHGG
jgi:uncharacterized phage-like protein YoqJ